MAIFLYPLNVQDKIHLQIKAYNYHLPNQTQRENTALNTANSEETPITIDRDPVPLFTVKTYIPGQFGDETKSTWEMGNVAFVGDPRAIFNSIISSKPAADATGKLVGAAVGIVRAGGQAAAEKLLGALPSTVRNTAEAAVGRRIAPNQTRIFKGTDGRTLPLSLTMTPRDAKEAENIIDIVDLFRQSAVPTMDTTPGGLFLTYSYPPIFDITVVNPTEVSAKSGTFVQYQMMALDSFSVKHGGSSDRFEHFHDGSPVATALSLNFVSLFPVFRKGGNWLGRRSVDARENAGGPRPGGGV